MEEDDDGRERRGEAGAVAADEGREGGGRRELGQGGGGPGHPPADGSLARQEQEGQGQEAQGLQMSAPRRLHHQERTPEVEDEDGARIAAGGPGHPSQDPPRREVEAHP